MSAVAKAVREQRDVTREQCVAGEQCDVTRGLTNITRDLALDALVRVTGYPREVFLPKTRLVRYLGMDSLQVTELVVALEKHFGPLGEDVFGDPQMTFGDLLRVLGDRAPASATTPTASTTPVAPAAAGAREERVEDFAELHEIRATLARFHQLGIENPYGRSLEGTARDMVRVDGEHLLNFATFNYLGLSGDPRVTAAATRAIDEYGTSASASRVAWGDRPVHRALERDLAAFLGCQDALVFASGHATNVTTVATLVGRDDVVLHDSLAHDSLIAGARLSGARRVPFPHNDIDALDRLLRETRASARRALIVVEGAYSMDGDLAPLGDLIALKRRHGALLFVDEAHSLGVVGATGRGIGEHAGVPRDGVDVWMGTVSKALASCGGYVRVRARWWSCSGTRVVASCTRPRFHLPPRPPPASRCASWTPSRSG